MGEKHDLARLLAVNPFFGGLDGETLDAVAQLCVTRSLATGQTLFAKGDAGDALYAVRRGQVRISNETEDGRRTTLNVLSSGDVFGEVALLDGRPRTASATAVEPTTLFVILRRDLLAMIERRPSVAVQFIELLCARIRWMSQRTEEAAFLSLEQRLLRRLVALAQDFGDEIVVSQEELALFVGSTRESVNRQLQIWKRGGLLRLGRGRIHVLDPQRMARLASSDT
ncbi:Crp/Fnr family transcriptional regulator [Methylobacterium marchantiae]|uniref:Crp/Fnr family transcriptional regulator n=1 Tax=Methylobacterium marchantiae TaxID=600331 RepID=A0ABW3WWB8_9HYPH|nr:CRP-like cAMP-activated global transcriptional regulator [Methylobacterium marchantiae]